tara:strand:- start:574 stop:684 length:111 start_codon:yes stop_codon:yes gene_type:complete
VKVKKIAENFEEKKAGVAVLYSTALFLLKVLIPWWL